MLSQTQRNNVEAAIHELLATLSRDQTGPQTIDSLMAANRSVTDTLAEQIQKMDQEAVRHNMVHFG